MEARKPLPRIPLEGGPRKPRIPTKPWKVRGNPRNPPLRACGVALKWGRLEASPLGSPSGRGWRSFEPMELRGSPRRPVASKPFPSKGNRLEGSNGRERRPFLEGPRLAGLRVASNPSMGSPIIGGASQWERARAKGGGSPSKEASLEGGSPKGKAFETSKPRNLEASPSKPLPRNGKRLEGGMPRQGSFEALEDPLRRAFHRGASSKAGPSRSPPARSRSPPLEAEAIRRSGGALETDCLEAPAPCGFAGNPGRPIPSNPLPRGSPRRLEAPLPRMLVEALETPAVPMSRLPGSLPP